MFSTGLEGDRQPMEETEAMKASRFAQKTLFAAKKFNDKVAFRLLMFFIGITIFYRYRQNYETLIWMPNRLEIQWSIYKKKWLDKEPETEAVQAWG